MALLAIAEFLTVSLTDACETDRHLTMFHMFTDMTMFLGLVLGANMLWGRQQVEQRDRRETAEAVPAPIQA